MITTVQRVVAFAVVTAALAGCDGSTRTAIPSSRTASPPDAGTPSPNASTLSAPSNNPTTCTVYESGYATQVIFQSQSFDVRAECQAWTDGQAGEGYLWGYEPASAVAETPETTQICQLTDPALTVTASVIEDPGFRPVSAAERAKGSSACARILAAGWTVPGGAARRTQRRDRRRHS